MSALDTERGAIVVTLARTNPYHGVGCGYCRQPRGVAHGPACLWARAVAAAPACGWCSRPSSTADEDGDPCCAECAAMPEREQLALRMPATRRTRPILTAAAVRAAMNQVRRENGRAER